MNLVKFFVRPSCVAFTVEPELRPALLCEEEAEGRDPPPPLLPSDGYGGGIEPSYPPRCAPTGG